MNSEGATANETVSEESTVAQEATEDAGFLQDQAQPAEGDAA